MLYSYRMFFLLVFKTYFRSRNTQARPSLKRILIMSLFLPLLFILNTMHWLGFLLDEILFRRYRKVEIKAPLFIVGIPRSGTSYTHRLLSKDTDRFITFTLWELLLAPSVSERKLWLLLARLDRSLGSPFSRMIRMLERRSASGLDAIHEIRLSDPEEDYFLLAPLFACYLMILPFPFQDIMGYLAFFDDVATPETKKLIMEFYKSCLKRHLYVWGTEKQLLSKNVSFGSMVASLNETFPDCRILCNVRNPLKSIPSHISSMMAGLEIFDNDPRGHEYRDQMIDLQRYYFSHLSEFLPMLPHERHAFLRMEDLKSDVTGEIKRIYHRFEYEMSDSFETYLEKEKNRERSYSSGHAYSLAAFDLEPEKIIRMFSDMMDKFEYIPNKKGNQPCELSVYRMPSATETASAATMPT
jgi:hypothetical protein